MMAALGVLHGSSAIAGDPAAGRSTAAQCQPCHGLDGWSVRPDAPHIAGQIETYLRAQLESYRSGKREHAVMSIVAASLSDEDIADLAAWYSGIEFTVKAPE